MKLIPIALLLVLAVAVSAQIGPEKSHHFQDGECNRNNDNCNWIIGHWTGHVTSSSTSLRFFDLPDRDFPLVNTPWAQEFDDLYCTDRHYDIPYSCTFGYSEEDDNLYQYCWFEAVTVEICPANYGYVRADNNDDSTFFAQSFATPAFFMTNRISSLENGISYRNLETNVEGCLPYDVASKDLFIGNLYDGFSSIGQCSPSSDDFGPSPVVPASCQPYFAPTTTPSTTSTTTLSTTSTTTPSTTSTTTPSTTSTTSTTTTSTSTTSTSTTTPTTTTSTTTTTTSGTTTTSTNPAADYGCSQIYDGQDAVYVFELSRVRPASFPYEHIDYSNSRCTGSDHHNCVCDRQSSSCNWLVGTWNGFLYAKGYNSFDFINFVDQPDYPFPEDEDDVRCQWGETATPFHCVYYFNEETDYLNSHCWYEETSGLVTYGSPYTTFAWEQWTEISSLNTGLVSAQSSADFLTDGECILFDRFDSDTFIAQFPDGFSDYQSCGEGTNISPDTVFQCVDGSVSGNIGDNLMFTLNYREQDATWHDWDVSSSLSPLIALSIVLAALLALF